MYWVVTANSTRYQIYQYDKSQHQLTLIKEEQHPESKQKDSELASDRAGRYQNTGTSQSSAYESHADPKLDEIDHFLKSLADECEEGRTHQKFEHLILIAPPRANGVIVKHMHAPLKNLILDSIKKDYTDFKEKELKEFLKEHWFDIVSRK